MNNKKNKKTALYILLILIIITGICTYKYIGSGSEEKNKARSYINMLIENDMIDNNVDIKKCISTNKSDPSKAEKCYSVTVGNYAIDMDAKYNVLGFTNQKSSAEVYNITIDKAKEFAEDYVKVLYDGECKFKETVKEEESQKIPYYTLIFSKCIDGIPLYNYNLSLKINKESGKLDGFSNPSINVEAKKASILINQDSAEKIVKEAFSRLNTFINFDEKTYKSYCEDKDKTELELCYVVSIKGFDSSGKDIKMKYFVSTESGEIINSEKNNVSSISS